MAPVNAELDVIVVSVPSKVEFELTYTLEPVTCKLAPVNAELDVIVVSVPSIVLFEEM